MPLLLSFFCIFSYTLIGRKVSDRIVSIDRYYVCPIVRGKETKSVKFGAKVNNIQIDGISFIEHLIIMLTADLLARMRVQK